MSEKEGISVGKNEIKTNSKAAICVMMRGREASAAVGIVLELACECREENGNKEHLKKLFGSKS